VVLAIEGQRAFPRESISVSPVLRDQLNEGRLAHRA
jgi:hypothetical protein